MGPMGLARSGGQILYDLAIRDVDSLLGSRERYASLIYEYLVKKDEPTEDFNRILHLIYPISMVQENNVTFVACLARIVTIEMLGKGMFIENQKGSDEG